MEQKSVISFYEIKFNGAEKWRWQRAESFVYDNYGRGAICRNIYGYDVDADTLKKDIKLMLKHYSVFRADIAKEIRNGANYMFIKPTIGDSVWGKGLVYEDFLI